MTCILEGAYYWSLPLIILNIESILRVSRWTIPMKLFILSMNLGNGIWEQDTFVCIGLNAQKTISIGNKLNMILSEIWC